jgi:Response regulator receiver domain
LPASGGYARRKKASHFYWRWIFSSNRVVRPSDCCCLKHNLEALMSTANAERVLIADDDPNLLAAYLLFFEGHGYEVRTAADGSEALAQYWAWLPGVVILDIQMPRLDGWTVAREKFCASQTALRHCCWR